MLRKRIVKVPPNLSVPEPGVMDITATAAVQVTSEDPTHPIDNVFDHRRGLGGSRWVAAEPGEQTLILAFDTPQSITRLLWKLRNQTSVARKSSGCPCRMMADSPTVRCAVKSTPSARLARPLSAKTGRCGLRA